MPRDMRAIEEAPPMPGAFTFRTLALSFRAHAIYFAIVVPYVLSWVVVEHMKPALITQDFPSLALAFLTTVIPLQILAIIFMRVARLVLVVRPARPLSALIADFRDIFLSRHRLLTGLPVVLAMTAFMFIFAFFKTNIPAFSPYSWDVPLAEWDKWLHFGRHPWEWLHPLLGYGPITYLVNVAYNSWLVILWMMWIAFALTPRPSVLRTRFFVSFMLIWIVGGTILAIGLASAGPVYFERLGHEGHYAGLMAYLRDIHARYDLWAVTTQDLLWAAYEGKQDVIAGISAMPSMHNATTLLFALAGSRLDRRLGLALWIYAGIIFVGSIHLAWHYAIDAYVGYALTLVAWAAAGRLAEWHERQPWSMAYRRFLDESAETSSPRLAIAQ